MPVYIAVILLLLFLSNVDNFGSSWKGHDVSPLKGRKVSKRDLSYEPSAHTSTEGSSFPKKIWQSWKVDPLGFEERDSNTARTWTAKNPGHRYEVLTDNNDLYYVETHFGPNALNRPDIIYMYRSLDLKIIKADLLRYLVMYVEGGIYADIDVEALRPVDSFIPERYNERDIDMVIGVEIDQPEFVMHPILGKKSQSFCQWTFMCKPRLPVMLRLIDNIIKWLNEISKEQGRPISEIELDFDQVISGTGPSAFTSAILAEMSLKAGETITWDPFHAIRESTLVGGILVLTVEAFAAGQGHSDSGNHNARTALVKHHYHASGWPNKHARYNHPVYGEVERCNWERSCVELWDKNKAAYEALNLDQQQKVLAFKQAADLDRLAFEAKIAAEQAFNALSKEDQEKLAIFDPPAKGNEATLATMRPEQVVKSAALKIIPEDNKLKLENAKKISVDAPPAAGHLDSSNDSPEQKQVIVQAAKVSDDEQPAPALPELKKARMVIPPSDFEPSTEEKKVALETLTPEEVETLAAFRAGQRKALKPLTSLAAAVAPVTTVPQDTTPLEASLSPEENAKLAALKVMPDAQIQAQFPKRDGVIIT